jgi:hypothetical protein
VQVIGAVVMGLLWLLMFGSKVLHLQQLPRSDWLVTASSKQGAAVGGSGNGGGDVVVEGREKEGNKAQ